METATKGTTMTTNQRISRLIDRGFVNAEDIAQMLISRDLENDGRPLESIDSYREAAQAQLEEQA